MYSVCKSGEIAGEPCTWPASLGDVHIAAIVSGSIRYTYWPSLDQ
jgi:hypothetical protein